eukprot:scaffold9857_cov195-Amphora_coffeaeformis.AAC.8
MWNGLVVDCGDVDDVDDDDEGNHNFPCRSVKLIGMRDCCKAATAANTTASVKFPASVKT